MIRDEVPGAFKRGPVHPGRLEPERIELSSKYVAHRANAREVHRTAVDVDDLLQQCERLAVVGIDVIGDRTFLRGRLQ